MFPVPYRDDRLEAKDVVLGVQLNDSYKAYSSTALRERRVVNDMVGGEEILVLGSAASQGAGAYYRGGQVVPAGAEQRRQPPRHPVPHSGRRRGDMAGDRGVSGQHGRRVGEAGADNPRTCHSGSDGSSSTRTRSCTQDRDRRPTSKGLCGSRMALRHLNNQ